MRVERVSDHIWALSTWVLVPIRVWVVAAEDGVTLVDAGLPPMAGGILRFLDRMGAGPLRRILLTHGHSDHTGAIGRIRREFPVPILAHAAEIPYMTGQLPYPRRGAASVSVAPGLAQALAEERCAPTGWRSATAGPCSTRPRRSSSTSPPSGRPDPAGAVCWQCKAVAGRGYLSCRISS